MHYPRPTQKGSIEEFIKTFHFFHFSPWRKMLKPLIFLFFLPFLAFCFPLRLFFLYKRKLWKIENTTLSSRLCLPEPDPVDGVHDDEGDAPRRAGQSAPDSYSAMIIPVKRCKKEKNLFSS